MDNNLYIFAVKIQQLTITYIPLEFRLELFTCHLSRHFPRIFLLEGIPELFQKKSRGLRI